MRIRLVFILFAISNCHKVDSRVDCDALKLTEGDDTPILSSELCTSEFRADECKSYVNSFKASDLPHGFKNDSLAVERPSSLTVEGIVHVNRSVNNILLPSAKISWRTPISEISRKYLEGFLLIWKDGKGSDIWCRIFQFNSSSPHLLKMITFSYETPSLTPSSNITFTVYSIPAANDDDKDKEGRFLTQSLPTFKAVAYTNNSSEWRPRITPIPNPNGTILVKFILSPPEFNLKQFEVVLVKPSSPPTDVFMKQVYNGEVFSFYQQEGEVIFENLSSGNYTVQVNAFEPYQYVDGKCLCWAWKNKKKTCQMKCKRLSTEAFYLNVTETNKSTTAATVKTPLQSSVSTAATTPTKSDLAPTAGEYETADVVGMSRQEGELDDKTVIILVSAAAALLITLTVTFICLMKNPRLCLALRKSISKVWSSKPSTLIDQSYGSKPSASVSPLVNHQLPTLGIKKLYIMSADDHMNHVQIVESLVNYLELHCYCQVVYPPRAEDIHKFNSPYSWFISHISTSDHIVFISSAGAVKLIEAHLNQMVYRDREPRPEGDLFTECLKHIYKDNRARDKLINIYFGASQKECQYVTSPFNFSIPRNLPELVLKLHNVNSKNKNKFNGKLPMLRENIPSLPAGAELLSAIEASRLFERNNPNWLKEMFGDAIPLALRHSNPKLEKMMSTTSGDSGVVEMGLGSVSTPDLSQALSAAAEMGVGHPFTAQGYPNNSRRNESDLPLSIYTVPYSNFTEDGNGNNRRSFFDPTPGVSTPERTTEPDCQTGVESDAVSSFSVSGGVDSHSVQILVDAKLSDRADRSAGSYDDDGHSQWSAVDILPPDTMSAVDDMSEALSDINKNSYFLL